jgi:hypothetical protein
MVLGQSAAQLMGETAPLLPEGYSQGSLGGIAMLSIFAATEAERQVDNLVFDIRGMQALFLEAAGLVTEQDAALAARLQAEGALTLNDFRVSVLEARRREALKDLIALHALVESIDGPRARGIERGILVHLSESSERRALFVPQPSAASS